MLIMIFLLIPAALCLLFLLITFCCFRFGFYAANRPKSCPDEIDIPKGKIYEPYRESMERWTREVRAMKSEEMTITSFDGLQLHARFYEFAPGAPMEIMFHGYRGSAERDLSGGVQRCFKMGRSCLLVDQRCSSKSQGHVITFGIREHQDALLWTHHAARKFPGVKIILTGISMGAATVMMTADKDLPESVIGILADCGYTSAEEIIKKVIRQMGLPVRPGYFFAKLAARIFGKFDLEADSPRESLKNARVPVIFFHGEDDDFVPCQMSRDNFEVCASRKKLVTVPGAGHGLSYPQAPEYYLIELAEFFGPESSYHTH